jgi:prepilin-type N-terminal cleavage/methylation domain-containing protein/prepilin-type processing-associated H-X9-DG protein
MKKGFTLIELLVVISIIAMLLAILMPALTVAKQQTRAVVCKSNLRQLVLSNIGYATENDDHFVLAASDINGDNNHRWHGVREDKNSPSDPLKSPLASYIGDGEVKECPEKVKFVKGRGWDVNFEQGGGGYGYNMTYIGSRIWQSDISAADKPTKSTEVSRPQATVMFADSAMAKIKDGKPYLLEYSFILQPFFLYKGKPMPSWGIASPSIHFRHRGKANIGWADGHVTDRTMGNFGGFNAYEVRSIDMMINWFDPIDNSLFDLR